MSFSKQDITDYYDQTLIHYKKWWKVEESLALHFGLWFEGTRDFQTALQNTNREMAKIAGISRGELILDAGCGLGGTSFFLAKEFNAKVHGITLSDKQLALAQAKRTSLGEEDRTEFSSQDFTQTNFSNNSFDIVWACESSCHAKDKSEFLSECYRILKPGGRLIIADYFLTPQGMIDEKNHIQRWAELWAIDAHYTWADLSIGLKDSGLTLKSRKNYTQEIAPSSLKMFKAAKIARFFSEWYNLFHKTSRFAKHHYRSGIHQYRALQRKEWEYWLVCLQKPLNNPSEDSAQG